MLDVAFWTVVVLWLWLARSERKAQRAQSDAQDQRSLEMETIDCENEPYRP